MPNWTLKPNRFSNFTFLYGACYCILDDDQDVHYCGKCRLSFTDLSVYIKHKANRICREILNKNTLSDVVEKLPIEGRQSKGRSKKKSCDATESAPTNSSQKTPADAETTDESPAAKRVEVQFLEPLVAGESEDAPSSVEKDRGGHKTVDSAKTGEFLSSNIHPSWEKNLQTDCAAVKKLLPLSFIK